MAHVEQPASASERARGVNLLLVSPFEEDHFYLREVFHDAAARLYGVRSVEQALSFLRDNRLHVVLCEHEFESRDSWRQLLDGMAYFKEPPRLIVASRLADERLWAEVLNLGGFDLLRKPFDRDELLRVVGLANPPTIDDVHQSSPSQAPRTAKVRIRHKGASRTKIGSVSETLGDHRGTEQ